MKLKANAVGTINILSGRVDITDPCYDKDAWCRHSVDVVPGVYDCFACTGEEPCFGERVWESLIILRGTHLFSDVGWKKLFTIGVDAGMAGFFENKPDFNREEWSEFCAWMRDTSKLKTEGYEFRDREMDAFIRKFDTGYGFWTGSGCGDGCYPVYGIKRDGKIIALKICFM